MKGKKTTAFICVISLAMLFACAAEKEDENAPDIPIEYAYGNSAGNIHSGGRVASQSGSDGQWIYYTHQNENGETYIYKMRADGSDNTFITKKGGINLNVIGETVYFTGNGEDNQGSIFSIRADGTGLTEISGDDYHVFSLMAVDDVLYFCATPTEDDDYYIYKINADGTEKTRITGVYNKEFNVVGDWIYYLSESPANIYKINADGTGKTLVCRDYAYNINIIDDWVYYINRGDGNYIYKVKTDGTGRIKCNGDSSGYLNVSGNWIYYSCENVMYRLRADSTNRTVLFEDEQPQGFNGRVFVAYDKLYYICEYEDEGYRYEVGFVDVDW